MPDHDAGASAASKQMVSPAFMLSLLPSSLMVVRLVPRVSCQSGEGAFRSRIDDVDDSHSGTAFGREMEDTVSLPHVT